MKLFSNSSLKRPEFNLKMAFFAAFFNSYFCVVFGKVIFIYPHGVRHLYPGPVLPMFFRETVACLALATFSFVPLRCDVV